MFVNNANLPNMRIVILAEIEAGSVGGGESVVKGLVRGLSSVTSSNEEYVVVCPQSLAETIADYESKSLAIVSRPNSRFNHVAGHSLLSNVRASLGKAKRVLTGKLVQGLPLEPPEVDQFILNLSPDVLHFAFPTHYARSSVPSVYTVHDLQHEYFPEYFDQDYIGYRRMLDSAALSESVAVAAISEFSAQSAQLFHQTPVSKLHVIRWPPFASVSERMHGQIDQRTAILPRSFVLFPALSYPHKNHLNLLKALSLLAERGVRIPLVCTGARNDFWHEVLRAYQRLTPLPELIDLAYVSDATLTELYRRAALVVFPSRFEGAGLPLTEAFAAGKAVACSDIPPFQEYGGDAPLYFDADQPVSIANTILAAWQSEDARRCAVEAGRKRLQDLSWEHVARKYATLYRLAGGRTSPADAATLSQMRPTMAAHEYAA